MDRESLDSFTHQILTALVNESVNQGYLVHKENPYAHALALVSACLAHSLKFLGRKHDLNELLVLRRTFEDVINTSKELC